MLKSPLLVDRGQYGILEWSVAMQPHTHCVFWHLSVRTSINVFSNLSYSRMSTWASVSFGIPWPCRWFTCFDKYWLLQNESCSFGDGLTPLDTVTTDLHWRPCHFILSCNSISSSNFSYLKLDNAPYRLEIGSLLWPLTWIFIKHL